MKLWNPERERIHQNKRGNMSSVEDPADIISYSKKYPNQSSVYDYILYGLLQYPC